MSKVTPQTISKKHKLVAFLITLLLLIISSYFVIFTLKILDDSIEKQPRPFSTFKNQSLSLRIYNNTSEDYTFYNLKLPKGTYLTFNYNKTNKKDAFTTFLETPLPKCTISRNFLRDIQEVLNYNRQNRLSLILESNDNQSSLKFDIYKTKDGYRMSLLQTDKEYIQLSARNIDASFETFSCNLNKDDPFTNAFIQLIQSK